jgi:hypothetical protein
VIPSSPSARATDSRELSAASSRGKGRASRPAPFECEGLAKTATSAPYSRALEQTARWADLLTVKGVCSDHWRRAAAQRHVIWVPEPPSRPHPVVVDSTDCPSFDELGLELDERIKNLRVGLSLSSFTSEFAVQALEWERRADGSREAYFLGVVERGNASVSDSLLCRFDSENRLIACQRECCRARSRQMTLDVYHSLPLGEQMSTIRERLCSPGYVERKGLSQTNWYFWVDIPVAHHGSQGVLLVFQDELLAFKGISPYY